MDARYRLQLNAQPCFLEIILSLFKTLMLLICDGVTVVVLMMIEINLFTLYTERSLPGTRGLSPP